MDPYAEDKITIIEGPPPTFELMRTEWTQSLTEGPSACEVALTRLRTFNGAALVERCHRAWRHGNSIHLEYRTEEGLTQQAPIVAARSLTTDEGDVLLLWVRINLEEHDVTFDIEGDEDLLLKDLDSLDAEDLMDRGYDLWDDDDDFIDDSEDDSDNELGDDEDLPNVIL